MRRFGRWPGGRPLWLTLATLAYILLGINRGLSLYDEAIPIVAAVRILDGDRPYRDFWSTYAPGQFYLLAGLFHVFGSSVILSRAVSAFAICATSILVYLLGRQMGLPIRLAGLASLLWTIAVGAIRGATLAAGLFSALAFALGSAVLFMRFLRKANRPELVGSGAALGVAMLFRHDLGLSVLIAEVILLIGTGHWTRGVRAGVAPIAWHVGAATVPVAVALGILMGLGVSQHDVVRDLVVYPLTRYAPARALPLPQVIPDPAALSTGRMSMVDYAGEVRNGLRFYFPALMLGVVAAILAVRSHRGRPLEGEARDVAFVWLIGLSMLPYAWVRSDIAHIVPAWLPALLLFAWLVHVLPAVGWRRVVGLGLAAAWSVVFVWGAVVAKGEAIAALILAPEELHLDPPRGALVVVGREMAPMKAAISYVQRVVAPRERIFVGNAHHDRLVLNDVMFYFLAGRRSATRYHELVPGLATTAEVQSRIVADLEHHEARFIVLREDPGYTPDPEGATVLDAFIRERFAKVETFDRYSVWRRTDRP